MFTQNIFPRDFVGNSMGLQNCFAAEDQDFIEKKYGVASMVENDTFVGVFLSYFLAELPAWERILIQWIQQRVREQRRFGIQRKPVRKG
jgi:hypothetical protein